MRPFILICLIIFLGLKIEAQSLFPKNYNLVYSQDFQNPQAFNDFEMTDKEAWRLNDDSNGANLELYGKSKYKARVRSPFNIALLKEIIVGDFILEAELNQTGKEYGHRDLCLFFGVNNSTNFYYVHIASKVDDHANNIFIVNDEPRRRISTKTSEGTNWGETNSWHKVRIERITETGSIKIYFDDMSTPIMEAKDQHFVEGRIGFGSFDDTGKFDNIKIWAPKLMTEKQGFFK